MIQFVVHSPIVVRIVVAKNMACPKLQLDSDMVTFLTADTPRLAPLTTSMIKFSSSSSANTKKTYI